MHGNMGSMTHACTGQVHISHGPRKMPHVVSACMVCGLGVTIQTSLPSSHSGWVSLLAPQIAMHLLIMYTPKKKTGHTQSHPYPCLAKHTSAGPSSQEHVGRHTVYPRATVT